MGKHSEEEQGQGMKETTWFEFLVGERQMSGQKSPLTLGVLQYPFHQYRVLCDALGDQKNAFWDSSATSQKITIAELKKKNTFYILLAFTFYV